MSKVIDKFVEAVKPKAVKIVTLAPVSAIVKTDAIDSGVYRLKVAQALPEFAGEEKVSVCTSGFLAFKDTDRRTMRTVSAAGVVHKQAI
jgi:hypothetical protein